MRLVILSDVHGNLIAFEAALKHAAAQGADGMVIAGDVVVGCPDSAACWDLARSLGCPILRGNHERYVADFGAEGAPSAWQSDQFLPVRVAAGQFTDAVRSEIGRLPLSLRLPGLEDVLFVHASVRDDRDTVAAYTPEADLREMFPGVAERYVVRAHNHVAAFRPWGDAGAARLIVTTGSVGLPLDCNPVAQYLVMDRRAGGWEFSHQAVPYDLAAAAARFRDSGYLGDAGPMARLFLRELVTATPQITPFLRAYAREAGSGLAGAVGRFLGEPGND